MIKFSVIIPVLNEGALAAKPLPGLAVLRDAEIIAVDGGSDDGTPEALRASGIRVLTGGRGRGRQCNLGASAARGDVLLFLHADTLLPANALTLLRKCFEEDRVRAGRFRLRFDDPHPVLKIYSWFTRFETPLTSFGDQCLAIRRDFFRELGGFPDWPLLEDVHFFRRLRGRVKIRVFPGEAVTSARRYRENGVIRQQWRNGLILFRYLLGTSPEDLARTYETAKAGRYAA